MSVAGREPPRFDPSFASGPTTRRLVVLVLALVAIHIAFQYDRFVTHRLPWEIHLLFDLDEESSVPTWVSAAMLAFVAVLCAGIAGARRRASSREAPAWRVLAGIAAFLSLDEVAGLHETVNSIISVSWTIPFGVLALAAAAVYVPFLMRQRAETRRGFVAFAVVYVAGAVGVEFVTSQFFDESNKRQFVYALNTAAEEGLEMLGVVILIRTLLRLIEHERAGVPASEAAG